MILFIAVLVILAAAVLTARGFDVRLVLLSAAVVLGGLAGNLPAVLRQFFATFCNEKFVIPICTAMGFAYVLKHTRCDTHLVRLLVAPVRRVHRLIVPGVVLIGFVVNIPVLSQTSVAVCLGAVVVPVMRAAGFRPLVIGSSLLLGASVGGELFNPGAPELITVKEKTKTETTVLAREHLPQLVLPMLAISTLAFWALTSWRERKAVPAPDAPPLTEVGETRVNLLKAFVPLVPLLLLIASGPPLDWVKVPPEWLAVPTADAPHADKLTGGRMVGLAMLVGVVVATAVSPGQAGGCVKAFFEGAGYGFANITSLIVAAVCFGEGIKQVGLAAKLGDLIAASPHLLTPLAAVVPWLFAVLSGSGMASTTSLYGAFYGPAIEVGAAPNDVGAMVSVGSAAGRTMSPVAAVAIMCGKLTDTNAWHLVGRVAVPLMLGLAGVVALRMCGVV